MDVKIDRWMRAAMADDTVVVELLLRLKHQSHASSSTSSPMMMMFKHWGIRRPRTRSLNRCDVKREKVTTASGDTTRFSPTTPLSWSGGSGSSSPFDGGFEESSRPSSSLSPPSASRSKSSIITNEFNSGISNNKRLKTKKTFAELKEEESSLLNERVQLTEKITTLRGTVKEQNLRNVNFKRFKVHDLSLHHGKNSGSISETRKWSNQQYKRDLPLYNRPASSRESGFEHMEMTLKCLPTSSTLSKIEFTADLVDGKGQEASPLSTFVKYISCFNLGKAMDIKTFKFMPEAELRIDEL
ncbi:hypothetical protein ACFE04_017272 [Oxalis oulophora]